MAELKLNVKMEGEIAIVNVVGSIDAHLAQDFDKKCKEVLSKTKKVILEVSGLDYIATAGLGVLMASFNDVKAGGGNIVLVGMNPKVRKVFDTMGFSKVLKIVSSIDEAKSLL